MAFHLALDSCSFPVIRSSLLKLADSKMAAEVLYEPRGDIMERTIEELETIVRGRICGVCTDRTVDGSCGLEEPSSCALFRLFPQVAQAVQSVNSDDVRDYIRAIRERVCSICADQARDGECEKRIEVQCSLDAYLLLVIDAIEDATGKSFDRTDVVISPNPSRPGWVKSPEAARQ